MLATEVLKQKIEHWCAASIRALADDASVNYKGHRLYVNGEPFSHGVAYLQLDSLLKTDNYDYRDLRGIADGIAMRLSYSDAGLHNQQRPEISVECWVFDLLEQYRIESLVPESLPGVRINLKRRFLDWINHVHQSGIHESHSGILLLTLAAMCRAHILREPMPELIENAIEATRLALGPTISHHLLALKKCTHDQLAFSQHALAIASMIQSMMTEVLAQEGDDEGKKNNPLNTKNRANINLLHTDDATVDNASSATPSSSTTHTQSAAEYTIFNDAYDREVIITKLVRVAQLHQLRASLDQRIKQQTVNISRLSRYLGQLFSSPKLSGWDLHQEQGYIDPSRLSRIVTSPNDHQLFRVESERPYTDCTVTILIDNSGSMKTHCNDIATMVDVLIRALEMTHVKTEVLGFTTGKWNGGRPYKEWASAGQPALPGRLNESQHIIYKTSDMPWRRCRYAIAGLLRQDLYRESLDGEALQWAYQRIIQRTAKHKIICVISDGSPMDSATLLANGDAYLDNHLKQVASHIENNPTVKLCALGLGLDLSDYYRSSLMMLNKELDTKAFFDIAHLLARAA